MRPQKKKKIKIAIVAPGFAPSKEVQDKIKDFIKTHEEYEFVFPKKLIQKNPMFANSKSLRAQFLIQAFGDDSVDVVWCLRGGYGSLPLLELLRSMPRPKSHKQLIGLSDITSLHLFVNQFWGWSSIHASNLDRWVTDQIPAAVLSELIKIIKQEKPQSIFKNIKPVNDLAKRIKPIKGQLTGGNLVTLCSHLGTPFSPSFKNKLLFLEEIGERGYRIDRCLTQLSLSGALRGCRGILLGQFTSCLEPDGKNLWTWVVSQWAKDLGIPVFSGVPSGHEKEQWPLTFGNPAEIKIVNDRRLLFIENKVR